MLVGSPLLRNNIPYYTSTIGQKLLTPNNLAISPSYNIGLANNNLYYPNSINNLALRRNNLDRLGRGRSYDVYGRGITPLLNKVGLGKVETQPRLRDFL